jgi:hypothetical protein
MTHIDKHLHRQLAASAQEAKEQGLTKLAHNIQAAIEEEPEKPITSYSYAEMERDIQQQLWKAAAHLATYWKVGMLDIKKLDRAISVCAGDLIEEMEKVLDVDVSGQSTLEPKVPGQS